MTNKVIHGVRFEWQIREAESASVIIKSDQPERWRQAELRIEALMTFIGLLII
jgi:hypothetical protein